MEGRDLSSSTHGQEAWARKADVGLQAEPKGGPPTPGLVAEEHGNHS